MKKLASAQLHVYWRYLDCKKRTKKNIPFKNEERMTDDEKLIHFMLENSSILEQDNEKSYRDVSDSINIMCKQLCPGQWCIREHCKFYSSSCAYYCLKTRPSVCKVYKKYIDNKKLREQKAEQR